MRNERQTNGNFTSSFDGDDRGAQFESITNQRWNERDWTRQQSGLAAAAGMKSEQSFLLEYRIVPRRAFSARKMLLAFLFASFGEHLWSELRFPFPCQLQRAFSSEKVKLCKWLPLQSLRKTAFSLVSLTSFLKKELFFIKKRHINMAPPPPLTHI